MTTNISIPNAGSPCPSFLLEDTDKPEMATSSQKRAIYRLLCESMQDGELREANINQIPYVTKDEAIGWLQELENSIW